MKKKREVKKWQSKQRSEKDHLKAQGIAHNDTHAADSECTAHLSGENSSWEEIAGEHTTAGEDIRAGGTVEHARSTNPRIAAHSDLLAGLNEQQRAAVVHEGSPLLILAGAGSGKTRVITTKIAYMIQALGFRPSSILAVTFTKKAAEEMKERAVRLEPLASRAQIRTFHSFGAVFLRTFASQEGVSVERGFTVYDDDDSSALLWKIMEEHNKQRTSDSPEPDLIIKAAPAAAFSKRDATYYAKRIALAKDCCCLPEQTGDAAEDSRFRDPLLQELYTKYQERLSQTGNVDFGDLILLPYLVLKNNASVRERVRSTFRAILVDEYQDSNTAQFKLLQELSGADQERGAYICAVGDDDQSIYKFRGAQVENILNFQNVFHGTTVVRLEQNYRSTKEILACAQNVVQNNTSRLGKSLISVRGKGKVPTLVFLPTQEDESEFCSTLIAQSHERGVPYEDWAILYRTNAQSLSFETQFLHDAIPYEVLGALRFYEREEVKDALSWLSFIANQRDEVAFRRICAKPPRGIGAVTQDKIVQASRTTRVSIVEAASSLGLSKKTRSCVDDFTRLVQRLSSLLPDNTHKEALELLAEEASGKDDELESGNEDTSENAGVGNHEEGRHLSAFVAQVISESGLEDYHREQDDAGGTQKTENLAELVNSALFYPCTRQGLTDFLDHVNLDRTLEGEQDEGEDRVKLITLHNTKGLEFPRVVITGMEAGVFPRTDKTADEIEEERRLFYVGITRAKDELYFTSCATRRLYGHTDWMIPSAFLRELGDGVRVLGQVPRGFAGEIDDTSIETLYRKGTAVFHDEWGKGEVVDTRLSDTGEFVVSVRFEGGGLKTFLPKYQRDALLVQQ